MRVFFSHLTLSHRPITHRCTCWDKGNFPVTVTNDQLLHRAYLASDLWKQKRLAALAFYGCLCNRCKEHGTDVHHKTYERVGGFELMEDLEILCRDCHKAHHRAHPSSSSKEKRSGIDREKIFSHLSHKQKNILIDRYNLGDVWGLAYALSYGSKNWPIADAAHLLGFDFFYSSSPVKTSRITKKGRVIMESYYPNSKYVRTYSKEKQDRAHHTFLGSKGKWVPLKDFTLRT